MMMAKKMCVCVRDVHMDKRTLSVLIFSFMSIIVIIVNFSSYSLSCSKILFFVHYVCLVHKIIIKKKSLSRGESVLYCWLLL